MKIAKPRALVFAALFLLTLLAYSNSFESGFVLDNKGLILSDPRVHEVTAENVERLFTKSYWWPIGEAGIHRPFTKLTFLFNYAILGNGDQPAGYHVINFLLHLANAWLVYLLAMKLLGEHWPSAALAALWAVHPVLTESVTNIVGRADLLAGAAVLGGLLVYLKSAEASGRRRVMWLVALFATALAGMFSKESAAVLLGVMVLYEYLWKHRWKALAAGCGVAGLALALMWANRTTVMTAAGHADFPFTDNPLVGAGFWTARLTAVKVMAHSIGLLFWPARLSSDYSYNQVPLSTGAAGDWVAWLAVAALAVVVLVTWRFHRAAFFFGGFASLTYLPSSNLLFPIGTIMAERFLYLPAIGVIGLVVVAAHELARRLPMQRALSVALLAAVVCLGARTWVRNADWRDDLSLASSAAAAAPNSYKAHSTLAKVMDENDTSHARMDAAIAEMERAIRILEPVPDADNHAPTYTVAGRLYLNRGDQLPRAEAMPYYRRALELLRRGDSVVRVNNRLEAERAFARGRPDLAGPPTAFASMYRLLSVAYRRLDDNAQALKYALYTQELAPTAPETYEQVASAYLGVDQPDQAAIALLEGAIITADDALAVPLSDLYRAGLDKEGCAFTRGLNPACPIVHRHMCEASARAIAFWNRKSQPEKAASVRQLAAGRFACEASLLDRAGK